jgi:hypothetical protein
MMSNVACHWQRELNRHDVDWQWLGSNQEVEEFGGSGFELKSSPPVGIHRVKGCMCNDGHAIGMRAMKGKMQ